MADEQTTGIERERQIILDARRKGTLSKLGAYTRLSGPGWLQSAITLGGGSLAGSLYVGIFCGFNAMWLQPIAMLFGVIMLSAIGYVALSTGERPFQAINRHVNPVLGWGWAIATLMANLVWAMPQFSLGTAAVRQNLLPDIFGAAAMSDNQAMIIICGALLVIGTIVVMFYDSGSWGIKLFEIILKILVGIVVVSFFAVVVVMSTSGSLDWGRIFGGFVPDVSLLYEPAKTLRPLIESADSAYRGFWAATAVDLQQDVMVTAAATAVGINMTFLLPYSMLKRGWDKDFRGLAIFDLATGLLIPFMLATGCVVIAAATQFHAQPARGFLGEVDPNTGKAFVAPKGVQGEFNKLAHARVKAEIGPEAFDKLDTEGKAAAVAGLPEADRRLAATLIKRDAWDLADALTPLTGKGVAQYVFGLGVVGMAISTIIILMLINGFVVCEMLGLPSKGWVYRLGCVLPGITGFLAPFLWKGEAKFWLAVPTSVFGFVLIPIAYITFALVLNSKSLLGEAMPKGGKRGVWNILMLIVVAVVGTCSVLNVWKKAEWYGIGGIVIFLALALIVHFIRKKPEGGGA